MRFFVDHAHSAVGLLQAETSSNFADEWDSEHAYGNGQIEFPKINARSDDLSVTGLKNVLDIK